MHCGFQTILTYVITVASQSNSVGQVYYPLQFTDEETEVWICWDRITENWQMCSYTQVFHHLDTAVSYWTRLHYKVLETFVYKWGQAKKRMRS